MPRPAQLRNTTSRSGLPQRLRGSASAVVRSTPRPAQLRNTTSRGGLPQRLRGSASAVVRSMPRPAQLRNTTSRSGLPLRLRGSASAVVRSTPRPAQLRNTTSRGGLPQRLRGSASAAERSTPRPAQVRNTEGDAGQRRQPVRKPVRARVLGMAVVAIGDAAQMAPGRAQDLDGSQQGKGLRRHQVDSSVTAPPCLLWRQPSCAEYGLDCKGVSAARALRRARSSAGSALRPHFIRCFWLNALLGHVDTLAYHAQIAGVHVPCITAG
ncbi:uncharacterized protein [Dermacentor andersoni]|uniref:uncharacterized protein isoform X1 n=1 Tax=Dermacentor andersoni TaxID=34620 RepID=UPI0024177F54|nr:uncharacterized protein LOC126527703 isoform X1 [Dermacentor andersoni]